MTTASLTISFRQYVILQLMVFGGTSFFLYPYYIIQSTSRSYWIPVVAWFLLGLAGAWIFTRMLAKKPGSDAYAVSKQEFGRIGILLFHLPLMAFAWNTIVLMIRAHAEIISMTMLHATPQWFLNAFLFVSLFWRPAGLNPSFVRPVFLRSCPYLYRLG